MSSHKNTQRWNRAWGQCQRECCFGITAFPARIREPHAWARLVEQKVTAVPSALFFSRGRQVKFSTHHWRLRRWGDLRSEEKVSHSRTLLLVQSLVVMETAKQANIVKLLWAVSDKLIIRWNANNQTSCYLLLWWKVFSWTLLKMTVMSLFSVTPELVLLFSPVLFIRRCYYQGK